MALKDLISQAKKTKLGRAVSDVVSSIDRDKEKPGFQLIPGGFEGGVERVKQSFQQDPGQYFLYRPKTLGSISQRAGKTPIGTRIRQEAQQIAQKPLTQRQQKIADVGFGTLSGIEEGLAGFTGANEAIRRRVLEPIGLKSEIARDFKPQTTAGKVAKFGGGVAGYALGPGKIFNPLEERVSRFVAPSLVKPLGRVGSQVGSAVAAEAATASFIAPISTLFQDREVPQAFVQELASGLAGRAIFGLAGRGINSVIKPIADKFNVRVTNSDIKNIENEVNKTKQLFRNQQGRFTGTPPEAAPSRRLINVQPTPDRPLGGLQLSARSRLQPETITVKNAFGQDVEVPRSQAGFIRLGEEPRLQVPQTTGIKTQPQTKPVAEIKTKQGKQEAAQAIELSKSKQRVTGKTPSSLEDSVSQLPQMTADNALKHKVTFLDYFRTPTEVLRKIGLSKQADQLQQAHQNYILRLPKEIDRVSEWYNRVGGSEDSSRRIFQVLDGQGGVKLTDTEKEVVSEIQAYLKNWADELDLPEDKRIASYITHIFEDNLINKEFDPELEKIIADKVPGSVYDPFLQKRLGKQGYVEDAFRALDAYVKRATRKVNMDPALKSLKEESKDLPLQSWKYIKNLTGQINMRPTDLDNLVDSFIKQSFVGGRLGQRPTARVTRKVRNATYRATLGLNAGSAVRNLTQGANTYAKLGEKYTARGYFDATKELLRGGDELDRVGVTADGFIQDRTLSSKKQLLEKIDKGLWFMFDTAEKINRGAAYFGAKAKALSEGKSMEEAIDAGIDMARKTQFTFGAVDTPVALQGDVAKTLLQFQSYNVKQLEFLGDLISEKNVAGLARYLASWALFAYIGGETLGLDIKDALPFSSEILEGKTRIGQTPAINTATGLLKTATRAPGRFGEPAEETFLGRLQQQNVPQSLASSTIPGYVQLKKTYEGIKTARQGYSESRGGRIRTPVEQTAENLIKGALFGQYSNAQVKEYFDKERSVLGEKQTETFKKILDQKGMEDAKAYYDSIIDGRAIKKQIEAVKETGSTEGIDTQKITTSQAVDLIKAEVEAGLDVSDADLYTAYLKKPLSMPASNRYEKSKKDSALYSSISTIDNNESLSNAQKQVLKQKIADSLGKTTQELELYSIAKENNDTKTLYAYDQIDTFQNRDELMSFLVQGRKPINGKILISDGVINNLVDDGIISSQMGKDLKNLDLNEDGSVKKKKFKSGSSKTSKATKIKVDSLKAQKQAADRYLSSIASIGLPSGKIRTQAPVRINVSGLTFGS